MRSGAKTSSSTIGKIRPEQPRLRAGGDLEAEAVEQQIRQAFAQVKAKACPVSVLPEEPKQAGERE